jgi:hypothetical protein
MRIAIRAIHRQCQVRRILGIRVTVSLGRVDNCTMMAKKRRFSVFRYSHTLSMLRYDTQKNNAFSLILAQLSTRPMLLKLNKSAQLNVY